VHDHDEGPHHLPPLAAHLVADVIGVDAPGRQLGAGQAAGLGRGQVGEVGAQRERASTAGHPTTPGRRGSAALVPCGRRARGLDSRVRTIRHPSTPAP